MLIDWICGTLEAQNKRNYALEAYTFDKSICFYFNIIIAKGLYYTIV